MRTWTRTLLISLLLALPAAANCADAQPPAATPQPPKQQARDAGAKPPREDKPVPAISQQPMTVKDFTPSESISEGLSVSFPSDI